MVIYQQHYFPNTQLFLLSTLKKNKFKKNLGLNPLLIFNPSTSCLWKDHKICWFSVLTFFFFSFYCFLHRSVSLSEACVCCGFYLSRYINHTWNSIKICFLIFQLMYFCCQKDSSTIIESPVSCWSYEIPFILNHRGDCGIRGSIV